MRRVKFGLPRAAAVIALRSPGVAALAVALGRVAGVGRVHVLRGVAAVGLALALGGAPSAAADDSHAPSIPPARDSTRVILLGTGTPNADPERSGPGVAIVVNGRAYLVDAGPGIVRRAAAAARRYGIAALEANRLDIVFVTHLHSDHTVGLPDLMLTPWVLERARPLEVYGPPGIRAMTDHLLAAYREDIRVRQEGLEPDKSDAWRANAHEIRPGVVYRDSNVTVRAIAVPHANWRYAFGYRFETADRIIVVSGDTRPSDRIADACNGCDVLVHEVYSAERLATRPPAWQRYHRDAHTSTTELAAIARRARPRLLVLYHQLFWGATDADLVREIARDWDGRVVSGRDLDRY